MSAPWLLLKLLFLSRLGRDPGPPVSAQRRRFADIATALEDQHAGATGFDRTLVRWRLESATATLRFIDAL